MTTIQIILSFCILGLAVLILERLKLNLFKKSLLFLFTIGCVYFIYQPEQTTVIALFLGVHRGVDMLFYFGFIFLTFMVIKLYLKIRKLEQANTKIIRNIAINNLKKGGE